MRLLVTLDALVLRPDQEAIVRGTLEELTIGTLSALWGSEMSTGKTVQACELIIRGAYQRVLIIGVKDTYAQWAERLEAQGGPELHRIDSTVSGRENYAAFLAGERSIFFVGVQWLQEQDWDSVLVGDKSTPKQRFTFKKIPTLDLVVFDEVHMAANRRALARRTLGTIPTVRKLAMSGTFYGNKFENVHSITRWLWPDEIEPSFVQWKDDWCSTETPLGRGGQPVTGKFGPVKKITGEKVPGEFVKTLPRYYRLDSPSGPVPAPEILMVDLSPAELVGYEQMLEESLMWLQAHPGLEPIVANLPIVKRTRMRQACLGVMSVNEGEIYYDIDTHSSKMFALKSVLDRPDWSGRQVGIYTESKRFAKVLVARMQRGGLKAAEWSGDVPSKKRDEIKRAFLAGEIQYIVAVISSFGTGLDGFQEVCNRVVWVSESDNAKDNIQAICRFWRTGGDLADFQHVKLVARGTIDEGIVVRNDYATSSARATMAVV